MKIAISALFFQSPASGTGQYLTHLLNALAEVDTQNEYFLLGPQPLHPGTSLPPKFPYHVKPAPAFARRNENIEKVIWEQLTSPVAARNLGANLFHIPHFAPPLLKHTRTIVTIHDV